MKKQEQRIIEAGEVVGLPTLLQARVRKGLTQAQIAEMTGIPYYSYKALEHGRYGCKDESYDKLKQVLGDFKRIEPIR